MEIEEIVEWVRIFLEREYITGEECDQLYRLAVAQSQISSLGRIIYHDDKYNPEARDVATRADEVSISGEAIIHLMALIILRRIDISDALKAGMERLEDRDGYKKKGEAVESDKITTLKGIRAAPGVVEGTAIVTQFATEEKLKKLLTNLRLKDGENILVACSLSPDSVSIGFLRAMNLVGIVTDQGGGTSHGAKIAREIKIPCVSGTETATKVIRSGDKIIVDGDIGEVVLKKEAKKCYRR